ncbi:uncharacterized protein LOC133472013 [Phyllopteryx taeniolatus]|uniref:uncharacterized protein LOC133472013 n=1 Tax=Phyllopteryx taeniolatus TaxID=161469 RepID=UPI002AD40377|nr:uncharacterized protein LOC133472013 [Phyllopteryx taeniolatus]
MKTSLLLGIFLGLWAMVYSTLVNSVTQIPIKSEEDVLREAVTDGFLVEHFPSPSLKSAPLQENPTTQKFNQTSSGTEDSDNHTLLNETTEGSTSGDGLFQLRDEGYSTTSDERNLSSSDSSTTLSPHSNWTSLSEPNATQSSNTTEPSLPSQTNDPESFYSASGNSEMLDQYSSTQPSITYTRGDVATSSFFNTEQEALGDEDLGSGAGFGIPKDKGKARIFEFPSVQGGEFYQVPKSDNSPASDQHKGHVTPDWIIILGFVVGVAALVMLCAAIATRDKWNGPRQASSPQTKVDSSQQQKAENEAFLQKDTPVENGNGVEYTVIPLEELPEKDLQ